MKSRYLILAAAALIVILTGCRNRIEEYEPYSTFDDRMAAAESGRPMTPDDQMPPEYGDQYAYSSSGGQDEGSYDQPRMAARSSSSSSQSDVEVPFSESRGPKHAVNVGAL
ncbi:hypothetical protein AQUSIP_19230 [Aquicella siphonis]|uniref:Lipoprotein n=1 Tax=Aquicella siphonis TaxID=254247 RepID=A0A5E4PJR9_9COXI|nr:hypothetical protein [Aquicella siphonis]VVC76601.1 hypothetical protein AQUSIP_19230 [Aquicella siphonis]